MDSLELKMEVLSDLAYNLSVREERRERIARWTP